MPRTLADLTLAKSAGVPGWVILVALALFVGGGIAVFFALVRLRGPAATAGGQALPTSEEEQLCRRFADLKNAGDATANDLLAPAPAVPVERVSNEEADRLDAQFILRNPFQVRKVLASGPKQFVLVVEGGCASEKLPGHGQRWLLNPEIVVTVQNGQILGLSARVHVER